MEVSENVEVTSLVYRLTYSAEYMMKKKIKISWNSIFWLVGNTYVLFFSSISLMSADAFRYQVYQYGVVQPVKDVTFLIWFHVNT